MNTELRDWDLWPSIVAYESDAGHIERMRRSFVALADAFRRVAVSAKRATVALSLVIEGVKP